MKSVYFTEEHDLFRQTVREFMEREVAPHADAWEEQHRIPREIFLKMGELGFLGLNHAEAYGGADADIFYSLVFLEELARSNMGGFCAAVGVQQYMATAHIYRFGSEELKRLYVAPSISGHKVGALAITEPDTGSDVGAIRTSAVRDGDCFVVNGAKTWITNGAEGDFSTLAVKTDRDAGPGGISLLAVDHDWPGVRVTRKLRKMGWHSSDTAELSFENVRVPVSHLIGEENKGFYYIMDAFQLERLVAAATAVGGCVVALEQTLGYMKQRGAFGRPIARFQALRHRLMDLFAEVEAVRQLTYHCAWLHQQGDSAVRETSMAKLLATELGKRVSDECLQMFGGFGYAEEYPLARFYRDARVGTIAGGTSEIMREILAKMVVDGVAFEAPRAGPGAATEAVAAAVAAADPSRAGEGDGPDPVRPGPGDRPPDTGPDTMPEDIESLMASLPRRHRPEKTAGWAARFHFKFKGAATPEWTVVITGEACQVLPGLDGQPDCIINTSADVYLGIEKGTQDPQMAFLMGKVKVSNLGQMQRFMKAFRPIRGRK
ncbi:MAG: acyl-CoA dehydrogenase family protein [Candidatus Sericytochromatia bacterium]|nr:acyl-CoA dehydrogenase family protein [Candidatus Tanganyikabacteria bacterium]